MEIFGHPCQRRCKESFLPLMYGVPEIPQGADEQWIFNDLKRITHIMIFFERDRVVLAVKAWSDY